MTNAAAYTPATLAARWGCSDTLVYDLLNSGVLRGFRLGKLWRIPSEAVEEYESRPVVIAEAPAEPAAPPSAMSSADITRAIRGMKWPRTYGPCR